MSNIFEITASIKELIKAGMRKKDITIMHCTSSYPTYPKDINLKSIVFKKQI